MKAYSLDLRERVAAACQQSGRIIGAVAAQCSVSVSSVAKLLQRQRRSGSLAPLPLRGGPAPCLDASSRAVGLPAPAVRCYLGRVTGVSGRAGRTRREPGDDGPCRAGQAVGWLRKKRASTPPNATPSGLGALRAAFVEAVQAEIFTCFKFVDETSTNLTY